MSAAELPAAAVTISGFRSSFVTRGFVDVVVLVMTDDVTDDVTGDVVLVVGLLSVLSTGSSFTFTTGVVEPGSDLILVSFLQPPSVFLRFAIPSSSSLPALPPVGVGGWVDCGQSDAGWCAHGSDDTSIR